MKRAKTNWNYCIGECTGLLISVPFKGGGGRGEKRSPKGFQIARFAQFLLFQSCLWKTISILFSLFLSLSLFFSSLLETHRKLSSPPFPSRASRFIRFSSAKISILFGRGIDTFSSSSPDIPEQPAPLPYVSLSHTRETFVARERERERDRERGKWSMSIYRSVRANRVQPRRKFPVASAGNSWNEGPFAPLFHPSSLLPFLSFFYPSPLSLSLSKNSSITTS